VAGAVVAGVVAVPLHGETSLAVRGQGATVRTSSGQTTVAGRADRAALRCNEGVPLAQALVGTGFGYLPARRRVQGEVVSALLPRIRDIRRGGSAPGDPCPVAAGRTAAFYERALTPRHYPAGGLIAA